MCTAAFPVAPTRAQPRNSAEHEEGEDVFLPSYGWSDQLAPTTSGHSVQHAISQFGLPSLRRRFGTGLPVDDDPETLHEL